MESSKKGSAINKIDFIVLSVMALLSLTPLFGAKLSGLSVILGLVYFFVQKRVRKLSPAESGLSIRAIPSAFSKKAIFLWIALPLAADVFSVLLSKWVAPDYLNHVFARSTGIISYDDIAKLLLQVIVLALGEEIAFRVFFQGTLSRYLPAAPAILITSVFFALSHLTFDSPFIMVYDLTFVFLNSVLYGIVFHKTKNGFISTFAHILSNLFGILLIVLR
ncbi:hypothetical protein SDC9_61828 [bioreactor metagenome]|uniref:CAAX prenyl protease 2/Lysostaphin resistance protein A-like domain-containing protein n=1 Tax=bioreactor metagenome TaxID=1076179 RepID=A0A644XHN2_9ZZZZ